MKEKMEIEWTKEQLDEANAALKYVALHEWRRGYSTAYIAAGVVIVIAGGILKISEMVGKKK